MIGIGKKMQEKIFKQLFDQAEIAQFDQKEYEAYEESLKEYRDLKNSIDTAFDEGREEGREEGRMKEKYATARRLKEIGASVDMIIGATGLTESDIENL